jgi:signal transduction histidine kinase
MKPSLRNAYFGWLLLLLMVSYLLLAGVLFSIEWHEARSNHTAFKEEYPELLAFFSVMAATLPVVVLAAWVIAGRLLRPLRQVLTTADHIRSGHLNERIPPLPHKDELSRLADTINDAFDRYSAAVRRLEHFSADASHQLRTPLTAIKSTAEVTLQSGREADTYQEALADILEQTAKLNETMDQLLLLSRLDRSMRDSFKPVVVTACLRPWIEDIRATFESVRVTDQVEIPDDLFIQGNEVLLHEVFSNLIDNAQAFTPEGGEIRVSVNLKNSHSIEWRIEDAGPGIPKEDRQRVFDRFFRGNKSVHKGSGLGLAIVREIILLHGGTVRVEQSERLGGAAIVITLPRSVA